MIIGATTPIIPIYSYEQVKRQMAKLMKTYRIFFDKDGTKMTKLVYAVSMSDVLQKYKDLKILSVVQIDLPPPEDEDD